MIKLSTTEYLVVLRTKDLNKNRRTTKERFKTTPHNSIQGRHQPIDFLSACCLRQALSHENPLLMVGDHQEQRELQVRGGAMQKLASPLLKLLLLMRYRTQPVRTEHFTLKIYPP